MVVALTADEMMRKGLELCGFDWRRQNKACRALNLRRFKAHFGSNPIVYAQIWEDLQTTGIREARTLREEVSRCFGECCAR
jgi:ribosomal protein L20